MEEEALRKDLEVVEDELLVLGAQIDDMLQKQEVLINRKVVLQSQLDSLIQSQQEAHRTVLEQRDWENDQFEWTDEVMSVLQSHFKLSSLRSLQSSAINATLSGEDVILIMPTGGGKSLCYQLPSLLRPGVSLVISPLVSLMEDQLLSAKRFGIGATLLNADSSREEVNRVHSAMTAKGKESDLRLLYVTPEKLSKSKRFMSKLEKMYELGRLARIVIDEVHCVSQWGHDFRPDYKILGILKRQFPGVPILGLTATATARVLVDCQKILSLKSCLTFRASYNRPNLFYEVRQKAISQKAQIEEMAGLIKTKFPKQSGIVYCLSRKNAEDMCKALCESGISAGCYHTDCLPQNKTRAHKQWLNGSIQVMVATIAFGMGIDKPDVRFVIHHSLSKSMENYYQESGRAGRDGHLAHCILFYRAADAFRQSAMVFTEHTGLSNLSVMMRYCVNETECRRALIARSFEEKWTPEDCAGSCDVCIKLSCSRGSGSTQSSATIYEIETVDVSKQVKDLVLMVEHNQQRSQRLTATKLVEVWKSRGGAGTRPTQVPAATDMTAEQCDRILVTALLEGVLKEDFHYTAYSTICYMGLGKKAQLAKQRLLKIEIKRLIECNRSSEGLEVSDNLKEEDATEDHQPCCSSSIEVSRAPGKKRKNKSGGSFSSKQSFGVNPSSPVVNEEESSDLLQTRGRNCSQDSPGVPPLAVGVTGRKGHSSSVGKGKKRKSDESVAQSLTSQSLKRQRGQLSSITSECSVIEIDDSD